MTEETTHPWPGIADVLAGLDQLGAELRDASPATLAIYAHQAKEMVANFREFQRTLEQRYIEVATDKKAQFPGIPPLEIKTETKRSGWQHEEVLKRVVAAARDERLFNEETGEALEDEYSALARVLSECARFEWRVTVLPQHGVKDPSEFCDTTYGAKTLRWG